MRKKELIREIVSVLKDNNIRKNVQAQKTILHITDDSGNHSDFQIKKESTGLQYTITDVENIIDAFCSIIRDCMRKGEPVFMYGFGTFGLNYRKERTTKHPKTREEVLVRGRYVPVFLPSSGLKLAASCYGDENADADTGVIEYDGGDFDVTD